MYNIGAITVPTEESVHYCDPVRLWCSNVDERDDGRCRHCLRWWATMGLLPNDPSVTMFQRRRASTEVRVPYPVWPVTKGSFAPSSWRHTWRKKSYFSNWTDGKIDASFSKIPKHVNLFLKTEMFTTRAKYEMIKCSPQISLKSFPPVLDNLVCLVADRFLWREIKRAHTSIALLLSE